eukprot:XP_019918804.1 PREDICTED: uncharacterized protein LOC105318304 isoform X2 [Crassostrea gigas]
MVHEICIILILLQSQVYKSEARYCKEAVASAALVASCPTSKIEWDVASRKKNCSRIASQQNCSPVEKFRYHCVINGFGNETLEVCAPSRIIFGHCVEFNLLGGVIQDQRSSPCNDTFPKCDRFYDSTAAYKYPDCYQLVSMNRIYPTTKKMPVTKKQDVSKSSSTENVLIISISTFVSIIVFITMAMAVKMVVKERRAIPKHNENVELTSTAAYLNKKEDDTMQQENKIWKPGTITF